MSDEQKTIPIIDDNPDVLVLDKAKIDALKQADALPDNVVEAKPIPPPPPGKIRLSSGEVIDRADVCFRLAPHKEDPSFLRAIDGTIYQNVNGTLKRLTFKKHERRRK